MTASVEAGLDLRCWSAAREPAIVAGDRRVSFAEAFDLGVRAIGTEQGGSSLLTFVATPEVEPLTLALAAVSLGRPVFPIHPRASSAEREALFVRAGQIVPRPETLAFLATSGSTGEPKLVELPRTAFLASARASRMNIPLAAGDRWLLGMTFAHAGGLSILTRCLEAGATIVLEPKFDPGRVIAALANREVNVLSVVPTMLSFLLDHPEGPRALAQAKAILVGGAACPAVLLERAWAAGVPALATYGLTEACSQVTTQRLDFAVPRTSSDSGLALEGTSVSIVDAEGNRLRAGEVGRIRVSGPTLMTGYVGSPPLAGALLTEDLGSIDGLGRLRVLGRADDMIVTGGENVHPLEVEAELRSVPGIAAALVAGVPDPKWGSIVGAVVVLEDGAALERVDAEARARIAAHKRPRLVIAVASLPERSIGKPDRRAAAAILAERRGSGS